MFNVHEIKINTPSKTYYMKNTKYKIETKKRIK